MDAAEVARGKEAFTANCAFCHGASARGGGQGGPDLTASSLVRGDKGGKQLGAFLQAGRPAKGMPAFHLPPAQVAALATFLHATIGAAPGEEDFGTRVLVGDAAAGRVFFEGAGGCVRCHSVTGDLRGIGSKYSPAVLQGRMVLPIGDGGYPGSPSSEAPRLRATIAAVAGRPQLSGTVVFLSDYAVTIVDRAGERHTITRRGDTPQVALEDPLRAHFALLDVLTDKQMHDLTAYLAGLK